MDSPPKPRHGLFHTLLAFTLSLVAAGLVTAYECEVGTTDQCLMSKGLFPYYWGVLFLLLWPLISVIGKAMRGEKAPPEDSDS